MTGSVLSVKCENLACCNEYIIMFTKHIAIASYEVLDHLNKQSCTGMVKELHDSNIMLVTNITWKVLQSCMAMHIL